MTYSQKVQAAMTGCGHSRGLTGRDLLVFSPLLRSLAVAATACSSASGARLVPASQMASRPQSAPIAADVPSFARSKAPSGEHVGGNHLEALPVVGYDPNVGVLLGAIGYYAMDGTETDPLFSVTPYRHRYYVQAVASTLGYQQYVLSYDGIYLYNSPYRLRTAMTFERNINANYFGVGARTMGPLEFQGRAHDSFDEQVKAVSALQNGVASPLYNHYRYNKPSSAATIERSILGGLARLELGAIVQYVTVATYDGTNTIGTDVDGKEVPAIHGPTKLGLDCSAGIVRGCSGGWNNLLKVGVAFDTRDFEPDPNEGVFADAVVEWSSNVFGSSYDYARFTTTVRYYWSLFPNLTELVLASRVGFSVLPANAPFFAQGTLGGTEHDIDGSLGGEYTLRGYRNSRFLGAATVLGNAELRWTFWKFHLFQQHFGLMLAPLFDVGRVFDRAEIGPSAWRAAYGGGLRVAWNHSSIFRLDFAASHEDSGIYVDVDLPF
jgi:outer membrane protein assembly factor BamA